MPTFIAWQVREVDEGNKTELFCDIIALDPEIWKIYNHILVALQYFIPLFVISYAYIHMAIILNEVDATTATRNDSTRALQNKRRVSRTL